VASLEAWPTDGKDATRSDATDELVLVMTGPMTRAGMGGLCERARGLLSETDARQVVVDIGAIADPDAVTVDALARLDLTVRRQGKRIRFRHACHEIHQLVALMGLGDVLRLDLGSRVEAGREAEEREQVRRVEEERDP
jgi:anti-anti-sigma regulatory factor